VIAYNNGKRVAPAGARSIHVGSVWHFSAGAGRRALCALSAGLAGLLLLAAADAEARPYYRYAKRAAPKAAPAVADKKVKRAWGPLLAVVSLRKQRISIYGSEGLITQSAVSTGQPGFPTPTGVFSVIAKSRYHRSNIYSGAPMPFMQRITWSGVALHAGVVPGYPASHGCIRLPAGFATELWGMTKLGARVVVSPDDTVAHELVHAALPVPTMVPASATTAAGSDESLVKTALVTAAINNDGASQADRAPNRLMSPLDRAQAAKAKTIADAAAKAKAARAAAQFSASKTAEANKAVAALRKAEQAVTSARARLQAATKAVEGAKTPEAVERAEAVQAAAQAALAEAEKSATEAAAEENARTFEAFEAARASWDAEEASSQAAAAKEATERSLEPISIFISKKAGKIYVRHAWAPVYEAAVSFKAPESPIGTHLYLATDAVDDGKALRWLSVSMQSSSPATDSQPRGRRDEAPAVTLASATHVTPAQALDRVELSAEARAFIQDKLWAGAALIISDQGISHETGKFTDFIVLAR
jgi:hypothetical protein